MAKSTCKHRAASVEEGLQKSEMELDTPSKSRKASVFGSLEKVFNMLTPKKQRNSSSEGPRKVKALHNVYRTNEFSVDYVLNRLKAVIEEKYIPYKQSDYTLRCTVMDDWGRVKLAFDLEVCTLPKMPNTGICRKRVKGDTWHYKKLCEDILASCKLICDGYCDDLIPWIFCKILNSFQQTKVALIFKPDIEVEI
ncbi:hypothetical protein KUTeg_000954 [Tegillarca granosa]|uniref:non-specific serine/threonine protein kinase n=1 Tax=Tegillarca granosa TaxID=220873 RepID=A0ABQ9G0L7_TEGGR|nr:hypothetical protein KUTeg_000954 [Tegillarca granosa]